MVVYAAYISEMGFAMHYQEYLYLSLSLTLGIPDRFRRRVFLSRLEKRDE